MTGLSKWCISGCKFHANWLWMALNRVTSNRLQLFTFSQHFDGNKCENYQTERLSGDLIWISIEISTTSNCGSISWLLENSKWEQSEKEKKRTGGHFGGSRSVASLINTWRQERQNMGTCRSPLRVQTKKDHPLALLPHWIPAESTAKSSL